MCFTCESDKFFIPVHSSNCFAKKITGMFEEGELSEKIIIFTGGAHFWLNGYMNKQNYRFWGSGNPQIPEAKSLHRVKVSVWAAILVIYLQLLESTVTGDKYTQLVETKFVPYARKRELVKSFYLCKTEQHHIERRVSSK